MRLDKFLKVSRLIKRRTVAKEACSLGRVRINGRIAKPGSEVKIGDILEIKFGDQSSRYEVLDINETVKKNEAAQLFKKL
ncbi:MAG TPA: RNA-binding S4 domain-containing protein [Clostridiales bacterium]|jgi:ribosomal 50S subunit-recycling heat shock protein|nr:RNA-binding S4 domain-containing protein [Clostridiales bacterium]